MRGLRYALIICLVVPEAAAARWLWPWDVPHQRQYRQHYPYHKKSTSLDCKRINEAVAFLSKDELDKELAELDKRRRQTIAKCRLEGGR